jgi:hypothetical protein
MNADQLFSLCNLIALVGWLFMALAPRWAWTKKIVLSGAWIVLLAGVYLVLIVLFFGTSEGNFSSLNGVMKVFENKEAVLAGWVHYLAFDLFVGTWIVSNSQKLNIRHLYILPCLFFTFMLGPIGLLMYFIVRAALTKQWMHENF